MAKGSDRVQLMKIESFSKGGDESDNSAYGGPAEISAQEDAIESAGIYLQDSVDRDEEVYIERDAGEMRFRDTVQTTPLTLSQLLGGGGGVSDHGLLLGLSDDDHPQYQLRTEKAVANGYASLDSAGDLPLSQLPNHSSNHVLGGIDEIIAQALGSGPALANYIMVSDGAGGWFLQEAPGAAFGRELYRAEDNTATSTTGTAIKLTLTTPSLPLGDYLVFFRMGFSGSSNNTRGKVGFRKGASVIDTQDLIRSNANSLQGFAGMNVFSSISGVQQYSLVFRKISGGGNVTARNARIITFRIA